MKKLTLGLSAAALALAGTVAIAQSHDMDKMGPGMMDPMAGKTVTKAEAMAMAMRGNALVERLYSWTANRARVRAALETG